MTVAEDILAFARSRPPWEQDLCRRIYTQANLSSEDLAAVLSQIKKATGFEGFTESPNPIPLSADHVMHRPAGSPPVVLASIGNVENAMRLASGQNIPFALQGLTIVYGENGSGKSGYGKLLKQVCRARRERGEEVVLKDAFADGPRPPATLSVRFRAGAADTDITEREWQAGSPGPRELSRVSVFDSRTAPLYADKEDRIEFLPAGLDVLPRLVKACDDLAQLVTAEVEPLKQALAASTLPAMPDGTPQAHAAALLTEKTALNKLPSVEELEKLGAWTEEDAGALKGVTEELLSDPATRARTASQGAATLQLYLDKLKLAQAKLNDDALSGLGDLIAGCISARDAAQLAATERFSADPLGALVGGEPWRLMFIYAAQVYEAAFPGKIFPSDGEARLCPLCEQHLGGTAFDRIQRFQAFVADTAQKDLDEKRLQLASLADAFGKIDIPDPAAMRTALAPYVLPESSEALLLAAMTAWTHAAGIRRHAAVAAARSISPLLPQETMPNQTIERVAAWHQEFETKVAEAETAAKDPGRFAAVKGQKAALEARELFHHHLPAILLRRNQLAEVKRLAACLPARHTQTISAKMTELCQKHLTKDFGQKLSDEMTALGIDYLPVIMRGRTDRGVNYAGPELTNSLNARTSNIVSEGEFKALALACFFAEIGIIEGHDGIILDDPVCSLDHNHVRQVASRLVKEAQTRQVIVFTHELSFYYELWHQAAEAQVPTARHWVKKTDEHGFGTVEPEAAPWQAMSVKDRLVVLEKKLSALKVRNDQDTVAYERAVVDLHTSLRETWERLVEEKLLNGVVGRFQPGVQTQSLSGVAVTDDDHRRVFFAMKRASEYSGHDWAKGRLPSVPKMQEMQAAIAETRAYMNELNKRAQAVSSERKKAVEAPPAAVTV